MEMSYPEFYNLDKTAKQSQLMSRYCQTNNKNNSNNNKYNRNDCGRGSLDFLTKKPGQWFDTNWEQTYLVMINCERVENEFSKKLFPWVTSRGLYWENELYN